MWDLSYLSLNGSPGWLFSLQLVYGALQVVLWWMLCSCNNIAVLLPRITATGVSESSESLRSWVEHKQRFLGECCCVYSVMRVCQIVITWSFPCCPILCLAFLQNIQEMKMTMKLCLRPLQVAGVFSLLFYFIFKPRHCFISHTAWNAGVAFGPLTFT